MLYTESKLIYFCATLSISPFTVEGTLYELYDFTDFATHVRTRSWDNLYISMPANLSKIISRPRMQYHHNLHISLLSICTPIGVSKTKHNSCVFDWRIAYVTGDRQLTELSNQWSFDLSIRIRESRKRKTVISYNNNCESPVPWYLLQGKF